MARQLYSPYAPTRKSPTLIVGWVVCFALIVVLMWYLNTRHPDSVQGYKDSLRQPGRARMAEAA